ncbi:hypothetical protein ACFLS1_01860 [Verrucomicrobiota bacterium]
MKRLLLRVLVAGFVFSLAAGSAVVCVGGTGISRLEEFELQRGAIKEGKTGSEPTIIEGTVKKDGFAFWLVDDKGNKVRLNRKIGFGKTAINTEDFLDMRVEATGIGTITKNSISGFRVTGLKKAPEKTASGAGGGGKGCPPGMKAFEGTVVAEGKNIWAVTDAGDKVTYPNRKKMPRGTSLVGKRCRFIGYGLTSGPGLRKFDIRDVEVIGEEKSEGKDPDKKEPKKKKKKDK